MRVQRARKGGGAGAGSNGGSDETPRPPSDTDDWSSEGFDDLWADPTAPTPRREREPPRPRRRTLHERSTPGTRGEARARPPKPPGAEPAYACFAAPATAHARPYEARNRDRPARPARLRDHHALQDDRGSIAGRKGTKGRGTPRPGRARQAQVLGQRATPPISTTRSGASTESRSSRAPARR